MADEEQGKRRAAERALADVADGMVLGLGSGSTAACAIRGLGARVESGLDIVGVPTSHQSARLARAAGVPVRCLEDVSGIDIAIDGADQAAGLDLIKGGGGAHAREKVIATTADRFVVIVDDSKTTEMLDRAIPLEALPDAMPLVEDRISALGGEPTIRTSNETLGPVVTDNGNFIVDCTFGTIREPHRLDRDLSRIPGTVEHGLFLDVADAVYTGTAEDVLVQERS